MRKPLRKEVCRAGKLLRLYPLRCLDHILRKNPNPIRPQCVTTTCERSQVDPARMNPWQRTLMVMLRCVSGFSIVWVIFSQFTWSEFIVISPVVTIGVATERSGIVLTAQNLLSDTGRSTATSMFFTGEYVAPRDHPPAFGFLHFAESQHYVQPVCLPGLRTWTRKQSKRNDKTFALFIAHPVLVIGAITAHWMYRRHVRRGYLAFDESAKTELTRQR